MTAAERLLRLYPRRWRARYGEEFLAAVGDGPLHVQQVIDIVSGAIDAWLSVDVRRAIGEDRILANRGGSMTLKSLMICESKQLRYTTRDALIGAAVMIGATFVLAMLGVAARRSGWLMTGEVLTNVAFLGSLMISMPFWLMKGQPWKAQTAIVGVTLATLVVIGYIASVN